ncbi:hypothetical protein LOZ58_003447 [Ophidiomyces ophidiicola]|nr:hypothetical protein LOZ65_002902 [Ophidiomyces ophidiicola]KAI1960961.1 hypothetical protein LOZ58_003447 [Ophidiomyces ophidiicola]
MDLLPNPLQTPASNRQVFTAWVVGQPGVGKRGLIVRHTARVFVEYDVFWDGSGRRDHHTGEASFVLELVASECISDATTGRRPEGLILLYSVAHRAGFDALKRLHADVQSKLPHAQGLPVLVVATMTDLPHNAWQVRPEEGEAFAESIQAPFRQCSALTGAGVDELMDELFQDMAAARSDAEKDDIIATTPPKQAMIMQHSDPAVFLKIHKEHLTLFGKVRASLNRVFRYKLSG